MSRFKTILLASALATPAFAQPAPAPDAATDASEVVVTAVSRTGVESSPAIVSR